VARNKSFAGINVFGGKGNIVLELFGRMVIPTTRWALFLGFDLIAFSSLDAPQRPAGAVRHPSR
jgi:hypothetical protein